MNSNDIERLRHLAQHRVTIIQNDKKTVLTAKSGENLSSLLVNAGFFVEHPCGGRGVCKKCAVDIDGEEQLSCQYRIYKDITVTLPDIAKIDDNKICGKISKNMCFVLDIGTTTLELALVAQKDGTIIDSIKLINPQRAFGGDVISRIDYCTKNGTHLLNATIINAVNQMLESMVSKYNISAIDTLFVAGNTTMLHLFFGVDCTAMGFAPYTPTFTDVKRKEAESIGIKYVNTIVSLPCISAFVGADIVAGLNFAGISDNGKYNLLIDMGTNAEIVLYNENNVLCTAAAAGPCFEGANIACGVSAVDGAIYKYKNNKNFETINCAQPVGICATGLIDIIAQLVKYQTIDKTGLLEYSPFDICQGVYLTQEDVRNFQLAKSAVYSAVLCLMDIGGITFDQIERVYIAGGFAEKMDIENATQIGLIPKQLALKCTPINNSALAGAIKFATGTNDAQGLIEKAKYIDLSANKTFVDLFIDNMTF